MSVDCGEIRAQLQAFLDGEVQAQELHDIRGHLDECVPCGQRVQFEQALRGRIRDGCLDEQVPATLRELVSRRLDEVESTDA